MSRNNKYDDLMLAIREDGEKEEEQKKSDVTLEQIRKEHALFQGLLKAMREAREECAAVAEVLQVAKDSADNAIGGICAAIVKAENTSMKARLDDASFRQLDRLHAKWIEQEKQVLGDQFKQQETLWQKQGARLVNIMKNNEGGMDFKEAVLHRCYPFPIVYRNHCNRDLCLCVFPLDSLIRRYKNNSPHTL